MEKMKVRGEERIGKKIERERKKVEKPEKK